MMGIGVPLMNGPSCGFHRGFFRFFDRILHYNMNDGFFGLVLQKKRDRCKKLQSLQKSVDEL